MSKQSPALVCQQCGKPVQEGDQFCGNCGAAILSPPPQAEQIVPELIAASQTTTTTRRRPLFLVGAITVLLILLVGTGAMALVAFNSGSGLFGSSEPQPADEPNNPSQGNSEEPTEATNPETTQTSSSESTTPSSEEELYKEFGREYDDAVRREDWSATYSMLYATSQDEFTEQEWAEKQQALVDTKGTPASLDSVTVDQNHEASDSPATVILHYKDGTVETLTVTIPMAVESGDNTGPQRLLTDEEISELKQLDASGTDSEGEAGGVSVEQQFVSAYYTAVAFKDWSRTYSMLDSASQAEFTEKEWIAAQESRVAVTNPPTLEKATIQDTSGEGAGFLATVLLDYADGTEETVHIEASFEDGKYKRHLTEEEISYLRSL